MLAALLQLSIRARPPDGWLARETVSFRYGRRATNIQIVVQSLNQYKNSYKDTNSNTADFFGQDITYSNERYTTIINMQVGRKVARIKNKNNVRFEIESNRMQCQARHDEQE